MKRIVIMSSALPDPRMNKRIRSISSLGCETTAICWKRTYDIPPQEEVIPKVRYVNLDAKNHRNLFRRMQDTISLSLKSYTEIEKISPDLIYVDGIECMFAAQKYKRKRMAAKIVLEISDLPAVGYIESSFLFGKTIKILVDSLVNRSDALVVTSPFFYSEYFARRTKFSSGEIFLFENLPSAKLFQSFKKKQHDCFRVAFIGSVRYFESIKTLFEAAKGIEGLEVVVSGYGPDYERVLQVSSMYSNVRITGQYNYMNGIASLYSDVDLVYAVYDTKGINTKLALPNKLYEAIVCGIPILVAKNTKLAEYVEDLGVGFSVENNNIFALRAKIERLINEPDLMDSARGRAKQLRERFYYENVERDFVRWLTDN